MKIIAPQGINRGNTVYQKVAITTTTIANYFTLTSNVRSQLVATVVTGRTQVQSMSPVPYQYSLYCAQALL